MSSAASGVSGPPNGSPVAPPASHPNLPRKGALVLTFVAIVTCGMLGGGIGYGLVRTSCPSRPTVAEQLLETVPQFHAHAPSCTLPLLAAALAGTAIAGAGTGVVAMLMLRAQSEWRTHPASRAAPPSRAGPASRARRAVNPPRRSGGTPPRT